MQKKAKKANVVVFDFDGTLSAFDSNFQFGRYCFRHSVRTWFFTPLILLSVLMRPFNRNGIWWRQCMRCFLTEKMVKKLAPDFIRQHKLNRFGWAAERVATEKKAGNVVLLISASPNYLLRPLVRDMGFDDVMCSEMYANRPWKYKFLCYNKNKVVALEKWAWKNKVVVNVVRSYSDSKSDMPIMKIAHEQVWINRKTGCRVSK